MSELLKLFKSEILQVLDETFDSVHGIYLDRGTSLFETLATISADDASRPVSPTCATLAAQTAHVRFYLDVLADAIEGKERGKVDWSEIWRTVSAVMPDEWETIKRDLRASYERVVAIINAYDAGTEDNISGAIAVLAHTAYHLGEIRQALCTIKSTA